MKRLDDLKRFYDILGVLQERSGGSRLLSQCSGRLSWPERGVYFFMEDGEFRSDSGTGPRIVRVGTHALKPGSRTTLWKRLSQHRGTSRSGGGNHRGSIFRLIVGTAVIGRSGLTCPTWDNGSTVASAEIRAGEIALERAVSEAIGTMRFVWVGIPDDPGKSSERGYIERNAIALLSNYRKQVLDPASPGWLGHSCDRPLVRESHLWNNNHVADAYDPAFLDRLEALART
ncbi:hypothetical protein [Methylocystis sp.]|uniref:hypothetical protein n=1 Tax=Methylocystis sp. TaxID=1911079 RepID=UPI0025E2FEA8|nr:hypothetical protein [Methylocystis sp.]